MSSIIAPRDAVRVVTDWVDSRQPELRLRAGQVYEVKARMGNTISLMGMPDNAWYFLTYFEKMVPDPVSLREAVRELAQALIHTREYVEPKVTLPAKEGWSWFDALKKHAPEFLPKEQCLAVLRRESVNRTDWYVRCGEDDKHPDLHKGGTTQWGDSAVGASYLKEQPRG